MSQSTRYKMGPLVMIFLIAVNWSHPQSVAGRRLTSFLLVLEEFALAITFYVVYTHPMYGTYTRSGTVPIELLSCPQSQHAIDFFHGWHNYDLRLTGVPMSEAFYNEEIVPIPSPGIPQRGRFFLLVSWPAYESVGKYDIGWVRNHVDLAHQVSHKVSSHLRKIAREPLKSNARQWSLRGPGAITEDELILHGLYHVSKDCWQAVIGTSRIISQYY
ncbi:uncharacterized protein FOMMEDRAFT_156403 [Fomitiporia mediterranea MF3/22]|uniref:uncharacterized protein n=1 Tax=Fomitiporia mediterranea (strain MF3/22) TaxID=694068 RepID=UPI00044080DC|nr:uncharacterized protein FOMMEDRAFT_156403 [Fomitiporia mediterranea MF3/22]EJD03040.1 hypothetical protein FOMMEDRAFT_156403 [Fomitiporia mediterranea MF3/22]